MKGFMHVVEIIVVFLAMIFVLLQFLSTPQLDTDWSGVSLAIKANDMLHALEASGIDWFDGRQVEAAINSTLNMTNLIYSVSIRNAIKPRITVGCICSDSDYQKFSQSLTGRRFTLNGQSPEFVVSRVTGEMPVGLDVIVAMDKDIDYTSAKKQLSNGGGLVEITDLNVTLAGEGSSNPMARVNNELFGVKFSSDAPQPTGGPVPFSIAASSPDSQLFIIYNLFHHIPNSTGERIAKPHAFPNLLGSEEKTAVSSSSASAVLSQAGSNAPALIVNQGAAGGSGRTTWLSAGRNLLEDDMSVLLKSLVVWSSGGKEYYVVPGAQMLAPMKATLYKVYNTNFMQPVEISLSMGAIYQQ